MNVPLWCTTGCSTSSLVRTTRMIELCFFASRKRVAGNDILEL